MFPGAIYCFFMTVSTSPVRTNIPSKKVEVPDFNPPLKRKEAAVPGYWTVAEIAEELSCSIAKVNRDVKGRPDRNLEPKLFARKAGPTYLIPDVHALRYIAERRTASSNAA